MVPIQQGFRILITGHLQSSHPPPFSSLLRFVLVFSLLLLVPKPSNEPGPRTPLWPLSALHALPEESLHNWHLGFVSIANLPALRALYHVPEHLGASSWTMWANHWFSPMHNESKTRALISTIFSKSCHGNSTSS